MRLVTLAAVGVCLLSPLLAQTSPEPYGYVVQIPAGSTWERVRAGDRARVAPGARLDTSDEVRSISGPVAGTLPVMLYSTGAVVQLRSGQIVPAARPARAGWWAQLAQAIARRLSNERLEDGVVRAASDIPDVAYPYAASYAWQPIVASLSPGMYRARFRLLDDVGAPAGDWSEVSTVTVTTRGASSDTFARPGEGLWELSIRHATSPSVGGTAWVLIRRAPAPVERFQELLATLDSSSGAAADASAVARVRRAAMLSLRP